MLSGASGGGFPPGVTEGAAVTALTEAVRAFNLPLDLPADATPERMRAIMGTDKKARGGTLRFALLERIGTVARSADAWTQAVPDSALSQVLKGA